MPTRVTNSSTTLTDNIFSNMASPNIISGNLTASVILDHFPQFLVVPIIFLSIPPIPNPKNMKEIGQNLTQKILFLFFC